MAAQMEPPIRLGNDVGELLRTPSQSEVPLLLVPLRVTHLAEESRPSELLSAGRHRAQIGCRLGAKRIPELVRIAGSKSRVAQPDFGGADYACGDEETPEQVIPDHPELAEVHLRILVLALVMPAVHFGSTDHVAERPHPVVEIGMLEGKVHRQEGKPESHRGSRGAQQHQRSKPGPAMMAAWSG